jgi:rubrerythrin
MSDSAKVAKSKKKQHKAKTIDANKATTNVPPTTKAQPETPTEQTSDVDTPATPVKRKKGKVFADQSTMLNMIDAINQDKDKIIAKKLERQARIIEKIEQREQKLQKRKEKKVEKLASIYNVWICCLH